MTRRVTDALVCGDKTEQLKAPPRPPLPATACMTLCGVAGEFHTPHHSTALHTTTRRSTTHYITPRHALPVRCRPHPTALRMSLPTNYRQVAMMGPTPTLGPTRGKEQ
ncbi:uncharacterized protein LOC135094182 [Scylla paramamosain]|uniref:uncharacterized protein LOC135094182 n=1 Tax=Scylla paramamosain TaxID=85552 RepID=UPI003082F113